MTEKGKDKMRGFSYISIFSDHSRKYDVMAFIFARYLRVRNTIRI